MNIADVRKSFLFFIIIAAFSTLAFSEDRDADGLASDVEARLGSSDLHKDVFVEIDWLIVQGRNTKPRDGFVFYVTDVFADAPVSNPDGTTGIRLHINLSQGIVDDRPYIGYPSATTGYDWSDFDAIKARYFTPAFRSTHHYCLFAKDIGLAVDSSGNLIDAVSGISRNSIANFTAGASDFIVSLGNDAWWDKWQRSKAPKRFQYTQAGTFLHELGHNLGLKHGNVDHLSFKPNDLSVMNYAYQTDGIMFRQNQIDYLFYDYSRFTLPNLDEKSLDETQGITYSISTDEMKYGVRWWYPYDGRMQIVELYNATQYVDWNQDGHLSTSLRLNLNGLHNKAVTVLKSGGEEWPRLHYSGGLIGKALHSSQATLPAITYQSCLRSSEYIQLPASKNLKVRPISRSEMKRLKN